MIEKCKVKLDESDLENSKAILLRLNNMYSQWTDTDAKVTSDVADGINESKTVEAMITLFDNYFGEYVELIMV